MGDISYLVLAKSGGSTNVDPALSLGGAMSDPADPGQFVDNDQYQVFGFQISGATTGTGAIATMIDVVGYDIANGTVVTIYRKRILGNDQQPVTFTAATGLVGFRGEIGTSDTTYWAMMLEGGPGKVTSVMDDGSIVTFNCNYNSSGVVFDDFAQNGTIAVLQQNLFDDVASSDSWSGLVDYRMCYLYHSGQNQDGSASMPYFDVRVWVGQQPSTGTIEIGFDASQIDTEPTAIADKFTAPAGITFQNYDSESNAIEIPQVNSGQRIPLWFRRTIAPQQIGASVSDDRFDIFWSGRS